MESNPNPGKSLDDFKGSLEKLDKYLEEILKLKDRKKDDWADIVEAAEKFRTKTIASALKKIEPTKKRRGILGDKVTNQKAIEKYERAKKFLEKGCKAFSELFEVLEEIEQMDINK